MSKPIQVYHNPRCSKSRMALEFLSKQGIDNVQILEYMKNPMTQTELKTVLKKLNMHADELVRKKEKNYKELGLENSSENELIKNMIEHPNLMERPIIINGNKAVVGRPTEKILDVL
jgi:arsenate reductase